MKKQSLGLGACNMLAAQQRTTPIGGQAAASTRLRERQEDVALLLFRHADAVVANAEAKAVAGSQARQHLRARLRRALRRARPASSLISAAALSQAAARAVRRAGQGCSPRLTWSLVDFSPASWPVVASPKALPLDADCAHKPVNAHQSHLACAALGTRAALTPRMPTSEMQATDTQATPQMDTAKPAVRALRCRQQIRRQRRKWTRLSLPSGLCMARQRARLHAAEGLHRAARLKGLPIAQLRQERADGGGLALCLATWRRAAHKVHD